MKALLAIAISLSLLTVPTVAADDPDPDPGPCPGGQVGGVCEEAVVLALVVAVFALRTCHFYLGDDCPV